LAVGQIALKHFVRAESRGKADIVVMIPRGGSRTGDKAKTHKVEATPSGFQVTSGSSGKTYIVVPTGGDEATCTCEWGRNRAWRVGDACSHILAVRNYAKALQEAADKGCSDVADVFRRFEEDS
jgi:hypothetical protein